MFNKISLSVFRAFTFSTQIMDTEDKKGKVIHNPKGLDNFFHALKNYMPV